MGNVNGVLAGIWNLDDWAIICHSCPHRDSGIAYDQLPRPHYCVTARATQLWAWNADHFAMLLRLLDGESITGDPYEWFATYAHGDWLRKQIRPALAKEMRRFLASKSK